MILTDYGCTASTKEVQKSFILANDMPTRKQHALFIQTWNKSIVNFIISSAPFLQHCVKTKLLTQNTVNRTSQIG